MEHSSSSARRPSWHPKEEPQPPRAPTPLPMGRIAVLVIVLLADTLSLTCVIPFAPFLVARYHEGPEYAVGYWSGLLAACYSIGQLISKPLWGKASDKYGRRPINPRGPWEARIGATFASGAGGRLSSSSPPRAGPSSSSPPRAGPWPRR